MFKPLAVSLVFALSVLVLTVPKSLPSVELRIVLFALGYLLCWRILQPDRPWWVKGAKGVKAKGWPVL